MLRKPKSWNSANAASRSIAARPSGVPVDRDGHVRVEADQFAAQQGLIAEFQQVFLALRARHIVGVIEHGFQRAELFEQLPGELRPDQRHARHVIDRVAHQGLKVDHLLRRDSPIGPQPARGRTPRSCGY